jgi:glutathione S-transferase
MCIMSELDAQGLWIHRKHSSLGHIFGAIPDAVAHAKIQTARAVGVLATELQKGGGPFLLGSDFSAADILLVHSLDWAELIGWGEAWTTALSADAKDMQCLAAYLQMCRSRPAYVRTVKKKDAEGLRL